MFRRQKKVGAVRRLVKRIREFYLYCRVYLAEKAAKSVGAQHFRKAGDLKGWAKFKCKMAGRKFYAQAAICRYARRSGTYKNL